MARRNEPRASEFLDIRWPRRRVFRLLVLEVKQPPRKEDSAEVLVGDEVIGVIFRDDEEGETPYQFQMAILDYKE